MNLKNLEASWKTMVRREALIHATAPNPRIRRYDVPNNYEDPEMSDFNYPPIDSLEPLPPEPAKPVDSMFRWIDTNFDPPTPPRPMTATEASIRGRNSYEPLIGEAPGAYEDALRYVMRNTMPAPRSLYEEAMSRAQAEASGLKVPKGAGNTVHVVRTAPQQDGWMPAGTYMPLKNGERPKMSEDEFTFHRYKRLDIPLSALGDRYDSYERGPGIASKIPERSRRFPSQTAQWGPYDIWDTLEDA